MKKSINEFPNRKWSPSSLNTLLTKTDQTGSVGCKPGSGKQRKARFAHNVDSELVLSYKNAPNIHKTGLFKTLVRRIVKQELKLQCEAAVL